MRTATALVGLFLGLAGTYAQAADAPPQPQPGTARAGNFIFQMPKDWTRKEASGATMLMPPQLPQGKWFELRLLAGEDSLESPEQAVQRHMGLIKDKYKIIEATPVKSSKHRRGWPAAAVAMSVNVAQGSDAKIDPRFWVIYAARPNSRIEVMYYVSNDFDVYKKQLPTVDKFINDLNFANLIVLAEGAPNLTQLLVDQTTDFLEWLVDVPFTDDQRGVIRQAMIHTWKSKQQKDIDGTLAVVKLRAQIAALEPAQADFARAKVQPEFIAGLRKEPSPIGQMLAQIYDAGHKPIADGKPPLTRQSADAMLEIVYFMASAAEGGQSVAPTPDEKNQWATKLAEQYAKMSDEQKNGIAQMPMTWAALRWAWPSLPDADKEKLKAQFGQFEPVKQVRQVIAAARKANNNENFIATMQRMQRQHETYMMLSNMSYQMHQTNMAIISNIGGNTRYEYQYRYR